jgi:glutamate---cysteine ligase / carboxylate-amine ligase
MVRPRRPELQNAVEAFRLGIEEEYFVCCGKTLAPATETPESLFSASEAPLAREMLQAQLEVATQPHGRLSDAREELKILRGQAARSAERLGFRILACGTHPVGKWREAVQTPKPRYDQVMEGLQMLGHRNMLCGMHVHVEIPEPSRRVDVMTRALPYLPLLLALSTSSPFWEGRPTGLKGYRLAAYDELPRTGLPDLFSRERDYLAYIEAMTKSGAISDATHVWWSIRPSLKYPTLELRIADSCTRVEDSVALAALYRAIVRHLYLNPEVNRRLDTVDRALAVENKWRAQRYGTEMTFVSRDGAIPILEFLDQVCHQLTPDMEALDCFEEMYHCRNIISEGSSADRQIDVFRCREHRGASAALREVCEWVARASVAV